MSSSDKSDSSTGSPLPDLQAGDYVEVLAGKGLDDDTDKHNVSPNGKRGTVIKLVPTEEEDSDFFLWEVLLEGEEDTRTFERHQVMIFKSEEESLRQQIKCLGLTLDAIITVACEDSFINRLFHQAAQNLDMWCPEEEIEELLQSDELLDDFIEFWSNSICMSLVWPCGAENKRLTLTFSNAAYCPQCSTLPTELEAACHPDRIVPLIDDTLREDVPMKVAFYLHLVTIYTELVGSLLSRQSCTKLLTKINLKLRNPEDENEVMDSPVHFLIKLAWSMGLCFPSLMDKITVVLSLIVVKCPTAVFSLVEIENDMPGSTALSIANYLPLRLIYISRYMQEHAQQSITSPTSEDDGTSLHYAVSRVIDFLPMLYYAGSWRQCYEEDMFARAAYNLLSIVQGFFRALIYNSARLDRRPDVAKFSHLANYSLCMEPLLQDCTESDRWRLELLQEHPLSFVVAGILEVVGWWTYKGYDIHGQLSHIRSEPHYLATTMGAYQVLLEKKYPLRPTHPFICYMRLYFMRIVAVG
jgi:hypothetical protein